MNIGIVTTWYERGAAYVSRQYAESLRDAGHTVCLFARGGEYAKGDPIWDGPNVHWARTWPLTDASYMQVIDFRNWLQRNRLDVVIFNEQRVLWPISVCQELQVRTVAYIDYYRSTSVRKFSCYDGLLCNTLRHESVFNWHPGSLYIPWGTDTELFSPKTELTKLVTPGTVTFFHSAGSAYRKGTDLLIRAFSEISGNAKLIIHLQLNILDRHPELKEITESLLKSGRLELIHKTVTAPGLYHLGDVYAYPTRLEGIGLSICEAMSCGLPAIVPDNGPMNEFVTHEETGLLTKVDSFVSRPDGYYWPQCYVLPETLTSQMQFCVDNPDWVLHAKSAARAATLEKRDWKNNSRTLADYIERLPRQGKEISTPTLLSRLVQRYKGMTDM